MNDRFIPYHHPDEILWDEDEELRRSWVEMVGEGQSPNELAFERLLDEEEWKQTKHIIERSRNAPVLDIADAQVLSGFSGELVLEALEELSPEIAGLLALHEGPLYLNRLKVLTPQAASRLRDHVGGLFLDGLEALPEDVAQELVKPSISKPYRRMTEEEIQRRRHLMEHSGRLSLGGLTELDDVTSRLLSQHIGILALNGIERLSDASAFALARHRWKLELYGLREVCPLGALVLFACEGKRIAVSPTLDLHKFIEGESEPSEEAGNVMSLLGSEYLDLPIEQISDAVAAAVIRYQGEVSLWGLSKISPKAARILLSKDVGIDLDLEKIAQEE